MTEADIIARIVKPWTIDKTYVVVPASGHFMFFEREDEADSEAYHQSRGYYTYSDDLVARYGGRLVKTYETWKADEAMFHRARIAASLDLGPVLALVEAVEPFRLMSGELFARNWNKDDVVIALDNPGDPHRLTFGDFLELHAALAAIKRSQP
jgi:hypothetical protein